MTVDPFDTARLRSAVLRAWQDSPARFREDANAEEALALGGYSGRALVELIANGVDAAGGRQARVLIRRLDGPTGPEIRVANTGTALTADGVAALASLRASAKRHSRSVGHFGVGFTSVLNLTDRPQVHSRSAAAAIGFDRAATAAAVATLPELDDEVAARSGLVPVLRLPFPTAYRQPPDGYETEIVLPLEPARIDAALDQLAALDTDLLWALPGLADLTVQGPDGERWWQRAAEQDGLTAVHSSTGTTRWSVVHAAGELTADLLRDRPVEERDRTGWWITWVRPLPDPTTEELLHPPTSTPGTIGAPLPTDEQLTVPARLFGTFPVDDTRRRLAPGPLTDHLLDRAARSYGELVAAAPAEDRVGLIPGSGFPAGPVDGALTDRILDRLGSQPLWDTAGGDRLSGSALQWVEGLAGPAVELLAPAVPGLLIAPVTAAGRSALGRIGGRGIDLSSVVAELAVLDRPADHWGRVYAALADRSAEDLAGVPVPLAGGGRRIGPRSVLVAEPDLIDDLLLRVGRLVPDLPLVHPDAAHPALVRWGARPADAATLLATPELQQRLRDVRALLDEVDPEPDELDDLASMVLDLLALDHTDTTVTDLVLTDDSGAPWPAEELLQPQAPLRAVLIADEAAERPTVHQDWTRWPDRVLDRAGVRSGFGVLTVEISAGPDDVVADWVEWAEQVDLPDGETVTVISDLDLVDDDAWGAALALIAADPRARAALLTPIGGRPGHAAWWIGRFARPGGRATGRWRRPGTTELAGVCEPFPYPVDDAVAAAIGLSSTWADLIEADPEGLLEAWADPTIPVAVQQVSTFTAGVRAVLAAHPDLPLPDRVRAADGSVQAADRALVVDVPWPVQVLPVGRLIAGGSAPQELADLLEVDLVSEADLRVEVRSAGEIDQELLERGCAVAGLESVPVLQVGLIDVTVDGTGHRPRWWPVDGTWWTDGSAEGIGATLAWLSGRWGDRHRIIAAAAGDWPDPTAGLSGGV